MGKIQQLGQRIVLRSPNIRDRTIKSSKENQNLKSSESKINHCRHASFEKNNILSSMQMFIDRKKYISNYLVSLFDF